VRFCSECPHVCVSLTYFSIRPRAYENILPLDFWLWRPLYKAFACFILSRSSACATHPVYNAQYPYSPTMLISFAEVVTSREALPSSPSLMKFQSSSYEFKVPQAPISSLLNSLFLCSSYPSPQYGKQTARISNSLSIVDDPIGLPQV